MKEILTVVRNPLGGIRTYLKYVYGALPNDKYHFTIIIVKAGEKDSAYIRQDLESRDVSFSLHEITGKNANKALFLHVYKVLNKKKFDLIHSQGFTSGFLTVLANMFRPVPHVLTSHDVFRDDQFEGIKGKIKKAIIELVLGRVTIIQSVGEDAQSNFIEYLTSFRNMPNKLKVIKNGIEIDGFAGKRGNPAGDVRKKIGIEEGVFLFGFLGRFMPQKGFEYLIDAIEILSKDENWKEKIMVLAANDGDYIKRYKRIINEKNLDDYFIFYGFVPDVGLLINELDAVVMPSLWEAYSLQPAEALIMGCPVLAADSIGLREVVKETPALIVNPRDGVSLADKMIYFMKNKEHVDARVKEYIPIAEHRYDIKHTANDLDKLFESVMIEGAT